MTLHVLYMCTCILVDIFWKSKALCLHPSHQHHFSVSVLAEEGQLDISMHGQENPKLLELKSMILEAYEKKEDSRGIIFAKTRALTTALCNWMSEDQQLQHLKPTPLTGANVAQDKAGKDNLHIIM